jgi:transposase InsO family protein
MEDRMKKLYYHDALFPNAKALSELSGETLSTTKNWLAKQRTYSLHKPRRVKIPKRRRYKTFFYLAHIQADLLEMIPYSHTNKGYKYIMNVIDVFSRYAWSVPTPNKSCETILEAFKSLRIHPKSLQTDRGMEFLGKPFQNYLKHKKIKHYSVKNEIKSSHCERFNRTVREKMFKFFTYTNKSEWIKVLPVIIQKYNNSPHSSLPKDVTPHMARQRIHWQEVYNRQNVRYEKINKPKFKLGDSVRISRIKGTFEKGSKTNWSESIYTISEVYNDAEPVMYNVKSYIDEVLDGRFYEAELQRVIPPDVYPIEKVHRRKGNKYLVTFLGYPGTTYWVDAIESSL